MTPAQIADLSAATDDMLDQRARDAQAEADFHEDADFEEWAASHLMTRSYHVDPHERREWLIRDALTIIACVMAGAVGAIAGVTLARMWGL